MWLAIFSSNCEHPVGEPTCIQDTCAECHLKYSIEQINRRHDSLQAETRELYQAALRQGRTEDAGVLSKRMAQQGYDRSIELANAAKRQCYLAGKAV